MKKRILCTILMLALAFTMIPLSAFKVTAAEMKTSASGIQMIKDLEGFIKYPVADNGQYSIGWGTRCPAEAVDRYKKDGIPEADAAKLLQDHLTTYETALGKFIEKNGLTLNQAQYDALICFTYNVGIAWMNDSASMFRQYVVNGAKGNDFIYAITRWCTASGEFLPHLARRRLAEANLYLNGTYSKYPPQHYKYVLFENCMDGAANDVRIQGYDALSSTAVRATATKNGYQFMGWYTKGDGGAWVTELNSATTATTLYGHWQKKDGGVDGSGNVVGTPVSYKHYITGEVAQAVHETPSASAKTTATLKINDEVTIVADYLDASNVKWGKISSGGWINLSGTSSGKTDIGSAKAIDPTDLIVMKEVAVRLDAGTDFENLGTLKKDEKITINYIKKVGNYTWGKSAKGWVCLDYTNYQAVLAVAENGNQITAKGVVKVNDTLNVRSGPSTDYPNVGTLKNGTKVNISVQKKTGTNTWGLTEYGWICLYYVTVTPATGGETVPVETTKPEETKPAETKPAETTAPNTAQGSSNPAVVMKGVVYNCDSLRIRKDAGVNFAQIGGLPRGTKVEILEKKTVNGVAWGKISNGWICLQYVQEDNGSNQPATGNATVVNCTGLNVRSAAGTTNPKVGMLAPGTKVTVTEQMTIAGRQWGKISQGWVYMEYIKMDDSTTPPAQTTPAETTPPASGKVTGTVVNCDTLRIRSGAGLNFPQTGSVAKNAKVTISETKVVGKATWGKVDGGWLCLDYIKLDQAITTPGNTTPAETTPTNPAEKPAAGSTGTIVNCETLRVRSGAGLNYPQTGSLNKNAKVTITETAVVGKGTWGKISTGWISLDYVKLDQAGTTGTTEQTTPPAGTGTATAPAESAGTTVNLTGVIAGCDVLRIRSGAGVNNPQTGTLKRGAKVTLLEVKVEGFSTWGKTSAGWICLDYVTLDASPATDASGIKTVNTDNLKVRKTADPKADQVGYYSRGTKVIILETTKVEDETWGRTANGWISMKYVK